VHKENQEMGSDEIFKRAVARLLDQVQYVNDIAEESPFFPQHIHIEPTNACNLRCVHCHHHITETGRPKIKRPLGMMEMEVFQKVIDEISPLGCSITLDVQGEPTLHPQFEDMVKYAKSMGVFTSVLTNATKLDDELTRFLIGIELDRIVFSFDSIDKELYEKIRVKSKFEPTLSNILHFIRINHEKGHHTHVCMSMVFQEKTRNYAEDYQQFFHHLPVDKVFLNPLLNLCGASGVSNEVELSGIQRGLRSDWPICRIPWEDLTVNWDGEVCSCPVDVHVVYSIGNVRNTSLQKLWNNERMKQFRRAHLKRDYSLVEENGPLCGSCNCMWQEEYDLRDFREYALQAIYRHAVHFAHQFSDQTPADSDQKYQNLLAEIEKLEKERA
jgi:radical SAM protein with 4Fe4S-binding SPASM domain